MLGRDDAESIQIFRMQLNGRYVGHLNEDLAYTVIIKDGNYNQLYHAADTIFGDTIEVSLPPSSAKSDEIAYRIQILVFRTDGSYIYRTDMYKANFTAWLNVVENVPQQTMPSEWLETTTASFVFIPLDTYTTAITVPDADYTLVEEYMLVPSPIERAYQYISGLMVQILNFRKLLFIIIFNIIIGLAIWLLH